MNKEETIAKIRQIVESHRMTYSKILFSKSNAGLADFILRETKFLDRVPNLTPKTRVYCLLNDVTELPRCRTCGKEMFRNARSGTGFAKYCSPKCENSDPDVMKKMNDTNLERYGSKWSMQSGAVKDRSKATMRLRYGVEYAQQNAEIKRKQLGTMLERYGSESPLRSDEIRRKAVASNMKNVYMKFQKGETAPAFPFEEYLEHGNDYEYMWRCLKCGKEFASAVNMSWFKQGTNRSYARCEKCYPCRPHSSREENELRGFVESEYRGRIMANVKSLKASPGDGAAKRLEIDVFLPDNRLGIEYDGVFWHSEEYKGKNAMLSKTLAAEAAGIRLVHVLSSEWTFKKEVVKSRLRNLLGAAGMRTIYARRCEIREVDPAVSNEFQDENHLQGRVGSPVNVGLYLRDELVSIMTFGKCRFDRRHEWELVRFCSKLNTRIVGGAGKLLKHFEKKYQPKSLVTYADRRWSDGNLYRRLGFRFVRNSPPNYWYFRNGTNLLESRVKYQKHMLKARLDRFDQKKTEAQNMKVNGYSRIFDCGNMVFEKSYNETCRHISC